MKSSPYIKDPAECTPEYVRQLHDWLLTEAKAYFDNPDFKACDERDYENFPDTPRIPSRVVKYGQVLLVDMEDEATAYQKPWGEWDYGHAYYIAQVTRRTHRYVSGRTGHLKLLHRVIDIRTELNYGDWRNGYFLLAVLYPSKP